MLKLWTECTNLYQPVWQLSLEESLSIGLLSSLGHADTAQHLYRYWTCFLHDWWYHLCVSSLGQLDWSPKIYNNLCPKDNDCIEVKRFSCYSGCLTNCIISSIRENDIFSGSRYLNTFLNLTMSQIIKLSIYCKLGIISKCFFYILQCTTSQFKTTAKCL